MTNQYKPRHRDFEKYYHFLTNWTGTAFKKTGDVLPLHSPSQRVDLWKHKKKKKTPKFKGCSALWAVETVPVLLQMPASMNWCFLVFLVSEDPEQSLIQSLSQSFPNYFPWGWLRSPSHQLKCINLKPCLNHKPKILWFAYWKYRYLIFRTLKPNHCKMTLGINQKNEILENNFRNWDE